MNRDYLPPTLKSLSQSPPNAPTFGLPVGVAMGMGMAGVATSPHSLPLSVAGGGSNSVPLVAPQTAANNRRTYRAAHCKLPTVQEGGKLFNYDLLELRTCQARLQPREIFSSFPRLALILYSPSSFLSLSLSFFLLLSSLSDNRTLQSRATCLGGFPLTVPGTAAGVPIPAKRYRTEKFFGCTKSAAFRKFNQFAR